jgi:Putative transmembrane protein (PGPGW)
MRRKLRIAGGFALVVVGALLALPGVPGPGMVLMLLGLWLLSSHFPWANNALQRLKRIRKPRVMKEPVL